MNIRPIDQLEQVQRDLRRDLLEVERIGEYLVELGSRLKKEPWMWSIDWADSAFPDGEWAQPIEPHLLDSLDRRRIATLLDSVRILRRREAELQRQSLSYKES